MFRISVLIIDIQEFDIWKIGILDIEIGEHGIWEVGIQNIKIYKIGLWDIKIREIDNRKIEFGVLVAYHILCIINSYFLRGWSYMVVKSILPLKSTKGKNVEYTSSPHFTYVPLKFADVI